MTATAVYRYFDATGGLLYVGATANPVRRGWEHSCRQAWWKDVASSSVEWFGDRETALEAEASAILKDRPRYNRVGRSPKPAPRTGRMVLAAWLAEAQVSVEEFADRIGTKPHVICKFLDGRLHPSSTQAERIASASGNAVPYAAWWPEADALNHPAQPQTLAEYISSLAPRPMAQWAATFEVSRPYLYALIDGTRSPSLDIAMRIAAKTSGAVPVAAWPNLAAVAHAAGVSVPQIGAAA